MFRQIAAAALVLAAPASAAPEWRQSRDYEVRLANFDIDPGLMRLKAGEPVRLRLLNGSNVAHNFSAADFFDRAQLRNRDKKLVSKGGIEVPAGQVREIVLVPAAGRYHARCSNALHRIFGMSSDILVE